VRRTIRLLAAVLATLVVASGCIPGAPDRDPQPTSSGPTTGDIAWEDCFDKAKEANPDLSRSKHVDCGTVTVPQDWNNPGDGRTFDIAVMRIYTGRAESKKGSVLTNPGGPGASGLEFLPYLVEPFQGNAPDALMDEFVMVTFDPRGVGESAAVDCMSDEDLDASYGVDPDPASQEDFDEAVAIARRLGEGCAAKYGDDLRLFATVQAAKDMDAIRAALGEEKLTYLGYSYGTLLGAVYAQLFPTHVRAFVLDGAVNPLADGIESSEGQAMGFERALTNFDSWCRANAARCPISADPKGAITDQIEKARVSPVRGPDGRDATAGWVLWGVTFALYSQDYWPFLGEAVNLLRGGDAEFIFLLADTYADRDPDGNYANNTDAFNAIGCVDGPAPTVEEIRTLQQEWRTKYPIYGTALATGLLNCSLWPGQRDLYPTGPAEGAPPIVVVGTTGDPATPYESTAKLAEMLGVGVVLTWEGEGHTAYPNTRCIQRAVDDYLIDLEVPAEGTRCPA
jgi:pimeloyl-ACP methyl ester carboxylesterase